MRCHNPPLGRNWTVLCLLLSVLQQIWTSCCYSNSAGCPCFPREHVCESSKLVVVTWQRLQSRQGLRERPLRLKPLPLSQWHKLGQKIPPQTRSGHAKLTRSLASRTLSHRGIVLALLNGFDEITTKKYIHCCFRGILLKVHAHAGLERGTLRLDLCHNPTRWAFLGLFGPFVLHRILALGIPDLLPVTFSAHCTLRSFEFTGLRVSQFVSLLCSVCTLSSVVCSILFQYTSFQIGGLWVGYMVHWFLPNVWTRSSNLNCPQHHSIEPKCLRFQPVTSVLPSPTPPYSSQ